METLQDRIIRHEGLRLHPYQDSLGVWTIGVGHRIWPQEAAQLAPGITISQALAYLTSDLDIASRALLRALPWVVTLDPLRHEVFVELTFNLGLQGLLGFHHTLSAARDGLWGAAAHQLLLSLWARQVGHRAIELASILQYGFALV